MQSLFSRQKTLKNESGAVMPLLAVVLVVGFFFAALGADLGDTMRRRGMLQAAIDSAVLRSARGLERGHSESAMLTLTRNMMNANLKAKSVDHETIDRIMAPGQLVLQTIYTGGAIGFSARSRITHHNWFAQFLDYSNETLEAPAIAKGVYQELATSSESCVHAHLLIDAAPAAVNHSADVVQATRQLLAYMPDYFHVSVSFFSDVVIQAPRRSLNSDVNRAAIADFISLLPSSIGSTRATAAGLQTAAQALSDNACSKKVTIIISSDVPDGNAGASDRYLCPSAGSEESAIGNSIAWADYLRENFGPVHVVQVGAADALTSNFFNRIAGNDDYNALSCTRPVTDYQFNHIGLSEHGESLGTLIEAVDAAVSQVMRTHHLRGEIRLFY